MTDTTFNPFTTAEPEIPATVRVVDVADRLAEAADQVAAITGTPPASFGASMAAAAVARTSGVEREVSTSADCGEELAYPVNALTGQAYRGKNIARLLVAAAEHGYEGPEWAGFAQWRKLGRTVRKGEHGTACLTVVTVAGDEGRGTTRPRGFKVFHRDQTEELPEAGEVS